MQFSIQICSLSSKYTQKAFNTPPQPEPYYLETIDSVSFLENPVIRVQATIITSYG
jgi:hypothetical protein